jgi:hypothetical protein
VFFAMSAAWMLLAPLAAAPGFLPRADDAATPGAAAAPSQAVADAHDAPVAPRKELTVSFSALGSLRQFRVGRADSLGEHPMSTGIPVYGGGIAAELGLVRALGPPPLSLELRYERGSTDFGLATDWATGSLRWLHRVGTGPLSLLAGGSVGAFFVERATRPAAIGHWGVGADLGLDIDLASTGGSGALFVRPTLDAFIVPHLLLVPRSLLWGTSAALGVRF